MLFVRDSPTDGSSRSSPGILPKLLNILSSPTEIPRVFVTLSLISQYGNDDVRGQILRGASQLVYAMSIWRYPVVIEHAVVTLAHCFEPQLFSERTVPGMMRETPLPSILSTTTELLFAPPTPSPRTVLHALPILMLGAEIFSALPERQEEATPILELLAVLIRSPDISLRCAAMWLFSHLYSEDEPADLDPPSTFITHTEQTASHEYCQMERTSQHFVVASWDYLKDRDLLKFGRSMVAIIQEAQYLYVDGFAPTPDDFKIAKLPFKSWEECLPAAAALLRQAGELDDADLLELEYLMITTSMELAASRAKEVMARNPQHVHAHFVFCTTSQDRETSFQVAIRGAELKKVTPFWRRQLLVNATELSGLKAWNLLLSASPSDWQRRRAGEEYLKAQLNYAETFISIAPPDSRDLPRIIDCYITCMLILRGPVLSADLAELKVRGVQLSTLQILNMRSQPLLKRLERSHAELKRIEYPIEETHTTKGHKALAQHFRTGIKKLSGFVTALDALNRTRTAHIPESAACWSPSDETSPRWADWLEGIAGSTIGLLVTRGPLQCTCGSGGGNPRVEIDTVKSSVALYRCSWCSQTTALVRRCGGCENAWYGTRVSFYVNGLSRADVLE